MIAYDTPITEWLKRIFYAILVVAIMYGIYDLGKDYLPIWVVLAIIAVVGYGATLVYRQFLE